MYFDLPSVKPRVSIDSASVSDISTSRVTFVWVILFGCYKQALKALPLFIVFGGAFALIAFFSSVGYIDKPRYKRNKKCAVKDFRI